MSTSTALERLRIAALIVDSYLIEGSVRISDVADAVSFLSASPYSMNDIVNTCLCEFKETSTISDENVIRLRSILDVGAALEPEDLPALVKLIDINRMLLNYISGKLDDKELVNCYKGLTPFGLQMCGRGIAQSLGCVMSMAKAPQDDPHKIIGVELLAECIAVRSRIRMLWSRLMYR